MKNKNVNNPDDYTFEAISLCVLIDCGNPAEWWLDKSLGVGKCSKCYNEMCDELEKYKGVKRE